jgi:2-isopropylmalate synthase
VPDSTLVLGKHSGRHALGKKCQQLGHELSRRDLDRLYRRFVDLADRIKVVEDRHLLAIMQEEFAEANVQGVHGAQPGSSQGAAGVA